MFREEDGERSMADWYICLSRSYIALCMVNLHLPMELRGDPEVEIITKKSSFSKLVLELMSDLILSMLRSKNVFHIISYWLTCRTYMMILHFVHMEQTHA